LLAAKYHSIQRRKETHNAQGNTDCYNCLHLLIGATRSLGEKAIFQGSLKALTPEQKFGTRFCSGVVKCYALFYRNYCNNKKF